MRCMGQSFGGFWAIGENWCASIRIPTSVSLTSSALEDEPSHSFFQVGSAKFPTIRSHSPLNRDRRHKAKGKPRGLSFD